MGWQPLHPDQRAQRFRRQRAILGDLRCPFERKRLLARWKRSAKNILVPLAVIGALVMAVMLIA